MLSVMLTACVLGGLCDRLSDRVFYAFGASVSSAGVIPDCAAISVCLQYL